MQYCYDDFKYDYDPEEDYIGREDELSFFYSLDSAFKGNAQSQYIMGFVYGTAGHGVKRDLKKAEFWYLKAAQSGHLTAQCGLGILYSEGELCKPDYEKALSCFLQSAKQGNRLAQTKAGVFLYEGKGAARNLSEAEHWLKEGARGGYAEAYYIMSRIHAADNRKYEENLKHAAMLNFGRAYADLCAFYLAEDRKEEAKQVYLTALKNGNGEAVREFDGRL